MTEKQRRVKRFINRNFIPGSIDWMPTKDDGIRITDRRGDSMVLTVNDRGDIVDADTGTTYRSGGR